MASASTTPWSWVVKSPAPSADESQVPTFPVRYRYEAASTVRADVGQTTLGLATTDPGTFFDGFVERADVIAAALLRVGAVAATRYYVHPSLIEARVLLADPIVTVGDGAVRFESLSACCGVAARLDLLDDGVDASIRTAGTTNVDLGTGLRRLLAGVGRRDPMRVVVGETSLEVHTLEGQAHERVVELPTRWVRSLAELQAIAAGMTLRAELSAGQARAFVRSLPARTGREPFWVQPIAGGLRLGSSPSPGAFAVGSPERLRVLEPVLRHATGLRVYGAASRTTATSRTAAASWWEVALPGARLGLGLSPELSRGFSGEGALLADRTDDPHLDLARRGLVGFDLATGAFFPRALPYGRDDLADPPRAAKARLLLAGGKVRIDGTRVLVTGSDGDHAVRVDRNSDTCTCHWYATHRGDRGPCAHVLAARLYLAEQS